MKANEYICRQLAKEIVIDLYETGLGNIEDIDKMIEYAENKISEKIIAHDNSVLSMVCARFVEAAKRCCD